MVMTQGRTRGVGELTKNLAAKKKKKKKTKNLAGSRQRGKVQIAKLTAVGKVIVGEKTLKSLGWKESTNSLIERLPSAQVNKRKDKCMCMTGRPFSS